MGALLGVWLPAAGCELPDLDAPASGPPADTGGSPTVDPTPPAGVPPGETAPPTVESLPDNDYCRPVSAASAAEAALEQQILELTNAARAQGATCGGKAYPPVGALVMDPALRCAARAHSKDMIDRKFFDHTNPSGEGPSQRVTKTGFVWRSWGENIAAGNATAAQTMQQWLTSAGHCQNLMNGGYRQIGVGYRPGGSYRHYWTQVFGTSR
jgi:uncharacterized protein YkwD